MKALKQSKDSSDGRRKVYRYSNFLQSKDSGWVNRNSKIINPEDVHDELDDEIVNEPIEEDIRD